MRLADLITSGILALFSVYLMAKSAELPIGWLPREGPGGGAFPFWLSAGMLICSILIFIRTLRGLTPEGQSTGTFMDKDSRQLFFTVLVSLAVTIGITQVLGIYVAIPFFLIFYMRVLGGHKWSVTLAIGLSTPVLTFLLFEKVLLILLPKGITDPLFYIFY